MRLFPLVFLRIRGGKKTKGERLHMQQIKQTGRHTERQANTSFLFFFFSTCLTSFYETGMQHNDRRLIGEHRTRRARGREGAEERGRD